MREVINIINQIRNTSSTNEKLAILKANKDNELLRKVLEYTYNPYKVYHMSQKSLDSIYSPTESTYANIFCLLDCLAIYNRSQAMIDNMKTFLSHTEFSDEEDLYKNMILKDLRCNISSTSINKVWKDLIPKFDVMLAKSYRDFSYKVVGDFIITNKLDGSRLVLWREGNVCKFYTRQGKEVEGLIEIEQDLLKLPDRTVFDGELIAENPNNLVSKDLFQVTRKLASKKGDKVGLEFHCFDTMPLDEFKKGQSKLSTVHRKNHLLAILTSTKLNKIKEVPILYYGVDKEMITKLHKEAVVNNQEGIMINLVNAKYVCKRTDTLLKVKEFHTVDLKIVGVQEGTGKYENSLGALLVEYKGNVVGVGSGYTDLDRNQLWNMRDEIIGRVVEVQFFEETTDEKTGLPSLRFPVYIGLREVGKDVSYN